MLITHFKIILDYICRFSLLNIVQLVVVVKMSVPSNTYTSWDLRFVKKVTWRHPVHVKRQPLDTSHLVWKKHSKQLGFYMPLINQRQQVGKGGKSSLGRPRRLIDMTSWSYLTFTISLPKESLEVTDCKNYPRFKPTYQRGSWRFFHWMCDWSS